MSSHFKWLYVRPWQLWLHVCRRYNLWLSNFFAWLGNMVVLHPLITIVLSLVLISICSSGLAFIQVENRSEKLYIPQHSESIENMKKAGRYGFYRPSRKAEIIILQSGGNVLKQECFRDALKLHELIISIPGYEEICLPNIQSDPMAAVSFCQREEPLWMFNYTSNFTNLLPKLNSYQQKNAELFKRIFGKMSYDEGGNQILSAQALRMIYLIKGSGFDEDVSETVVSWEKEFLKKVKAFSDLECDSLVFTAERSINDAITASTQSDTKFIALTFILMILFTCLMLSKYRNPLTGHGLLAMSGIICVVFGIFTGFGLSMLSQTPFVSIAGFLPFLIMGVGIDDMFIIVDELDRTQLDKNVPKRISKIMRIVGPRITMTTLTDVLAFAVGLSSKFPSIVFFCTYAAFSVIFAFIFLVSVFIVFMSFDCRRMIAGRRDILPCLKVPSPPPGAPQWDEPLPQTSNNLMAAWGRFLMKPPTKLVVVIISICLLALGIYGTTFVSQEFDRRDVAKDGSEYIRFLDTLEEYFSTDEEVELIFESGVNYSDPSTEMKINDVTQMVVKNKFYRSHFKSWFSELQKWYKTQNTTLTLTGSIDLFLNDKPGFRKDVIFAEDNSTIKSSRFYFYLKGTSSSIQLRDAMTTLRSDLKKKTTLPVFATAYRFANLELYVSTLPETIQNLALAAASILVVTSLFLVNPLVIFLVLVGFVSLLFELIGFMYLWDVSLNSISMIILVMAIGFTVDYSGHIAHSFVFSSERNPEEKVVSALKTVGASVIMGGFSTFLGLVVTVFASSNVFRMFFKMFLGIIALALMHGLCFLPVWLSIICRRQISVQPEENNAKCTFHATSPSGGHAMSNINHAMTSSIDNIGGKEGAEAIKKSQSSKTNEIPERLSKTES